MKIVAISDTHGKHRSLKLPKGDLLLHAGDVSYRGDKEDVQDFLRWFASRPFALKIFIAGNHDFFFEKEKPEAIQKMLPDTVVYLKDAGVEIEGIKIWGSPFTPRFHHWAFNRERGKPMAAHWQGVPAGIDVLLTHGPAYGILDLSEDERHAGDKDLLKRILELKPKAHVCGHIHEGYGTVSKYGTLFVNACVLNESDSLTHPPVIFKL